MYIWYKAGVLRETSIQVLANDEKILLLLFLASVRVAPITMPNSMDKKAISMVVIEPTSILGKSLKAGYQ